MARSKIPEPGLPSLSLVFGYIAIKELGRLEDRVVVLDRLGYGNAEISRICGTTESHIRTIKSRSRKPKRRSKS